jgi:hypothetical protein
MTPSPYKVPFSSPQPEFLRIAKECRIPDELVPAFLAFGTRVPTGHLSAAQKREIKQIRALANDDPAVAQALTRIYELERQYNKALLREARRLEAEAEAHAVDIAISHGIPVRHQNAVVTLLVRGFGDSRCLDDISALLDEVSRNPRLKAALKAIAMSDVSGAQNIQEALQKSDLNPPPRHR